MGLLAIKFNLIVGFGIGSYHMKSCNTVVIIVDLSI